MSVPSIEPKQSRPSCLIAKRQLQILKDMLCQELCTGSFRKAGMKLHRAPDKVEHKNSKGNKGISWKTLSQNWNYKGENLRHDHVLITVNIFSIKRK